MISIASPASGCTTRTQPHDKTSSRLLYVCQRLHCRPAREEREHVSNCIAGQRVKRRAPPHDNLENVIEIFMCTYVHNCVAGERGEGHQHHHRNRRARMLIACACYRDAKQKNVLTMARIEPEQKRSPRELPARVRESRSE